MALVGLAAKIGQTIKNDGHVVTHVGIGDPTGTTIAQAMANSDVIIVIDKTKFTTKNQVRSALREMFDRAIADPSFSA